MQYSDALEICVYRRRLSQRITKYRIYRQQGVKHFLPTFDHVMSLNCNDNEENRFLYLKVICTKVKTKTMFGCRIQNSICSVLLPYISLLIVFSPFLYTVICFSFVKHRIYLLNDHINLKSCFLYM